ncbi:MAG: phenylacetate-CoA oxygenase subunit PaaC [Chloroflexi bacterium]|nr:phenylacetate-CoA oxygenase subunit PaaC [Chloroflexota bacterium]
MNEQIKKALARKLLAMADDELILGHRNSEWTGHAPILEEDIAFANIAQDEIGHAVIWYTLQQDLTGKRPDELVFFREPSAYRCTQFVELPKGDWAVSMLRQYLFDTWEMLNLTRLQQSQYQPIAAAAAKMRPEELYHYRHTQTWMKRLGLGTDESNRRCQNGLNMLWPYVQQLFVLLPDETMLVSAGFVPDPAELHEAWAGIVYPFLEEIALKRPFDTTPPTTQRHDHTTHLTTLLADMQEVARLEPNAKW